VDPAHVATVIESERRRGGAAVPVALRALTTGREFVVEDGARDVLSWIGEARWAGE
jgi:hypothetical protein